MPQPLVLDAEEEAAMEDGGPGAGDQLLGLDPRLAMDLDDEGAEEDEDGDGEDEDGIDVSSCVTE